MRWSPSCEAETIARKRKPQVGPAGGMKLYVWPVPPLLLPPPTSGRRLPSARHNPNLEGHTLKCVEVKRSPTKYLTGSDLSGPRQATIRSVTHEPMFDGALRPVIYCDDLPRPVVVNKTNADVLYGMAGTDDDVDWPGLTVELYTEMVRSPKTGKTEPAIRFPWPRVKAQKRQLAEAQAIEEPTKPTLRPSRRKSWPTKWT